MLGSSYMPPFWYDVSIELDIFESFLEASEHGGIILSFSGVTVHVYLSI